MAICAGGSSATHQAVRAELAGGADIVASRAHNWPRRQADKWGAVLCMGFVYFRAALDIDICTETSVSGEVMMDLRSFPPKMLLRAEAEQFTMLAVVQFAEMRLNQTLIPGGSAGDVMKNQLRGYGYEQFKMLVVSGDLEVPRLVSTPDGTGVEGVDVYYGPQLNLEMQDYMWVALGT